MIINIAIVTIVGFVLGFTLRTLKISALLVMSLLLPLCLILKSEAVLFMLIAIYLGGVFYEKPRWHCLKANENGDFCANVFTSFFKFLKLVDYNPKKTKMRLTNFSIYMVILFIFLSFTFFSLSEISKAQFLALSVFCITSVICFQASNISFADYDDKKRARFLALFLSFMSAAIGLMIATIGLDIRTGLQRYSMRITELFGGIDFVIVVLGLCCLGEILYSTFNKQQKTNEFIRDNKINHEFLNTCKVGDFFSAMCLGIPFSQASAIIVGAFALYGVSYSMEALHITAGNTNTQIFILILFIFSFFYAKMGAAIKKIHKKIKDKGLLSPAAFYSIFAVMAFVGAYAIHYRVFDMFLLIAFGLLGFLMRRLNFPITPLIVCAAFGSRMEDAFRTPFSWSLLTALFYSLSVIVLAIYIKKAFKPDNDCGSGANLNCVKN